MTDSPTEQDTTTCAAIGWTAHPAAREPLKLAGIVLVAAIAAVGGILWMGSVLWGAISAGVIVAAVLPFLLRTHYRISDGKLHVRTALYRFERDLRAFRAFEVAEGRLWLCTRTTRARLDNYRGLLIHLGDATEAVREALIGLGLRERS